MEMQEPTQIDYAGSKAQRFMGWVEKTSFTALLPIDVSYLPGNLNNYSDMLSRAAQQLRLAAQARKASKPQAPPSDMHYYQEPYTAHTLQHMSQADAERVECMRACVHACMHACTHACIRALRAMRTCVHA